MTFCFKSLTIAGWETCVSNPKLVDPGGLDNRVVVACGLLFKQMTEA